MKDPKNLGSSLFLNKRRRNTVRQCTTGNHTMGCVEGWEDQGRIDSKIELV